MLNSLASSASLVLKLFVNSTLSILLLVLILCNNKLEELLVQDENGVLYVDSNAEAKTISNEIAKALALQLNRDVSETKKANSDLTAILSSYNLNSDTFAQPIANFNAQASIGYQKAISKMLSSESSDFATRIKKQGKFKEAITNAQSKTNVNTKSTDELFSKIKEASFGSLGSINDSIKSSNINDLQKLSEKISTIDTDKDPVSSKNLKKIQKLIDREIKSRDKTFSEAKYTSTYESVVDKDLVGKVKDFTNGKSSKQVSEELNSILTFLPTLILGDDVEYNITPTPVYELESETGITAGWFSAELAIPVGSIVPTALL